MSALSRNLSTRKLYIIGLAVPLFLTIVIGYLQWRCTHSMLRTRDLQRYSRTVQLSLSEFRYSLSDAESCQFRYVISHNDVNLSTYDKFLTEAQTQFKKLQDLAAENPQQLVYLDQIAPLFNAKVASMNDIIAKAKSGDTAGALQASSTDDTVNAMLSLENIVQQMQSDEAKVVLQRQGVYQSKFELASQLSVAGMVLCLACIMTTLILLRQMSRMQAQVTLGALTQLIEYEGGMIPIDEYLRRRRDALVEHGDAQIEAERLLGLLERHKLRPVEK